MIRLLEVLATLKRAGAETMVSSLVRRLDRTRFEPTVVSLYDAFPEGLEPELASAGVPVVHLGKRRGFDPRIYTRLRRLLSEFQPHIVHTHSYVMRYALPIARCAMVHTVHNLAENEVDALGRAIHRIGYKRGVVPVAVAEQVKRSFESVYGFSPQLIPNGIDTSRFQQARGPGNRIVSVARLDPQKNPLLLAGSVPPGCELVMVGDGSLRPQLEGRPGVRLLGVRSDISDILASADIFALASDWEGHPIALMEAMAAGLPVVATAVGGVPEIVGVAGVLVPPRDAEALRSALSSLAADPEHRAALGERARARAATFDVRNMVAAYSALFERIAAA